MVGLQLYFRMSAALGAVCDTVRVGQISANRSGLVVSEKIGAVSARFQFGNSIPKKPCRPENQRTNSGNLCNDPSGKWIEEFGVIAVDTLLPPVDGWELPLAPLSGLPILVAGTHPLAGTRSAPLSGRELIRQLEMWGARARLLLDPPGGERISAIRHWLTEQPVLFI